MANLKFAGCDIGEIIEKFGAPLYIMSEDDIRARCREVRASFTDKYENTRALFASKACQTLDICRIVTSEGMGLDVVSGGEIYAALKAGVDPAAMVFHGNAKSREEMRLAVKCGVGMVCVDNLSELEQLDEIAGEAGIKQDIIIRVIPGVDSHTHSFISTGQLDSKFGFAVEEVLDFGLERMLNSANLSLRGIHFHVGSQLHECNSHVMATEKILEMLTELNEKYGYVPEVIDTGGGFGIHYFGDPKRTEVSFFMDPVMKLIDDYYRARGLKRPTVIIEPGRWIVGEAGITAYEITSVKTNAAGRVYYGVDGGLPDNIRPALYDARYECESVENHEAPHDQKVTIAGKCCESGDILIWDAMMPAARPGDHMVVYATGAYNYSMASNYNRVPRPAMVLIKDGEARLSVRRETYDDLIAREL